VFAVYLVAMLLLILGPLLIFAPLLARARRQGLRQYSLLANDYNRAFHQKWVAGPPPADEPLLGSADIQSLADLGNSFGVVQEMRIVPVTRDALLRLVGATMAPIVPLALTMMSLEDLLKKLMGILF